MADCAAREPRWNPRVLRLRHLRRVRARHRSGHLSEHVADCVVDGVVCGVCGRLSGAAARRHHSQPLRRSLRPASCVYLVGVRHVGRDARNGPGAGLRAGGRCRKRTDGCLTADSGLLPRRRAARRADLRGRNGAEDCAARVRGGLLMRHARRRRGHRSEPGDPHVSRSGAGAAVRLASGFHFGRTRRRADLRAPALARGIARVRANAQPRVAAAVSGAAADSSGAGAGRVRVARRDRLLQWPLLLAPTRILVGRSSIRPTRRRRLPKPSA